MDVKIGILDQPGWLESLLPSFHIVFLDDPVDDGKDKDDEQDGNQASQDAQQPRDGCAAPIDEVNQSTANNDEEQNTANDETGIGLFCVFPQIIWH